MQAHRRRLLRQLLFSAALLGLAACQQAEPPASAIVSPAPSSTSAHEPAAAPIHAPSASPFKAKPKQWSLVKAKNYQTLIERTPENQRLTVDSWYRAFAPMAMDFVTPEEWRWMQSRDFLLPDDIMLSENMSDEALRTLSLQGDAKATFLYLARLILYYNHAYRTLPDPYAGADSVVGKEMTQTMYRALATGSPYAGYMFVQYYATLHGQRAVGLAMIIGLQWAGSRGDSRQMAVSHGASRASPGIGITAAVTYFDIYVAAARINPYFADAYRGVDELFIPSRYRSRYVSPWPAKHRY